MRCASAARADTINNRGEGTTVRKLFDLPKGHSSYRRTAPLVLVNGLAEQSESWFANRVHWSPAQGKMMRVTWR